MVMIILILLAGRMVRLSVEQPACMHAPCMYVLYFMSKYLFWYGLVWWKVEESETRENLDNLIWNCTYCRREGTGSDITIMNEQHMG